MSLEPGHVVGEYEIVGRLGRGCMGEVYKARRRIANRMDAIKVLLPDVRASDDSADRFQREIRVHAGLRHPNIAELYTAFPLG